MLPAQLDLQIMRRNRPRSLHRLDVRSHRSQPHIFATTTWGLLAHEQEVEREADVERIGTVDLLDVLARKLERKRGDVAV